jgi:hypothetical protein
MTVKEYLIKIEIITVLTWTDEGVYTYDIGKFRTDVIK